MKRNAHIEQKRTLSVNHFLPNGSDETNEFKPDCSCDARLPSLEDVAEEDDEDAAAAAGDDDEVEVLVIGAGAT